MYTEAPTGMSREQLYDLLFNRAAKGNQRNPYEEKAHRGPGHQWLHTCIPGQGWECSCRDWYIHGLLCKAVANKGWHIPAQTPTTLTWCERPAWAGRWRSGHDGHLIIHMDGMEDTLQGGRDEMRGFGGRAGFTPFARIFTGSSFLCVCWVCVVCLAVVCFAFFAGEMTPACNSSFTLFCFRIPRELTDHAPCSLSNMMTLISIYSSQGFKTTFCIVVSLLLLGLWKKRMLKWFCLAVKHAAYGTT